jgi:hypothetical protein
LYSGYPIPPSTRISVPVMYDASSDAKNATTACGSEIHQQIRCAACGEEVRSTDIRTRSWPA